MSNLPPKATRSIAAQIARAMHANDSVRIYALYGELMQQLPAASAAAPEADAGQQQSPDVELIGIWARDKNNTAAGFKRLETCRSEWRLWADTGRFRRDRADGASSFWVKICGARVLL